jgi:hypothetical protein
MKGVKQQFLWFGVFLYLVWCVLIVLLNADGLVGGGSEMGCAVAGRWIQFPCGPAT